MLHDVKAYAKKHGITEHHAYDEFRAIEGACFMTLSAFTGMRISELTQIDSTYYKKLTLTVLSYVRCVLGLVS